ncbi:MAG: hypothetical protein AAGA56_02155 [Myxococcota bacterium]
MLLETARANVSLARLLEGHADACAILREAGDEPTPRLLYAIWASRGTLSWAKDDGVPTYQIYGEKPFCSGATIVDRALVYVDDVSALVHIDPGSDGFDFTEDDWRTFALEDTRTWRLKAEGGMVIDLIGGRDWYFRRKGFWPGALAPAACWAGAALGLVDCVRNRPPRDAHDRAQLGALRALEWELTTVLHAAAREVESGAADDGYHSTAVCLRHVVERVCKEAIERCCRLGGPRAMAGTPGFLRRLSELRLYLGQHHGDRDLADLAGAAAP